MNNNAQQILVLINQILASFTLIVAVSLLAFIIINNRKSAIGQAFSMLLACMCFTYAGDVALFQVTSFADAIPWLKFQWIGIAFTPAAYLHFSDSLLRMTNAYSRRRRATVLAGYLLGTIFLYLAVFSEVLVQGGFFFPGVTQFVAGPFFWIFTLYFFAAVILGVINTLRARDRCLTSATRQRMTYLIIALGAPAFGVFPYMLVASQTSLIAPLFWLTLPIFFNIGIALMIIIMAYSVSFFDAFAPDRVVRYRLVTFLLRGPLVAMLVSIVIIALPDRPILLGLPREAILISLIVGIIVLAPIAANYLKQAVTRMVYRTSIEEVELLRYIDDRLLTTSDLRQALENVLTAMCELLRVRTGFIANVAARSGPRLETSVGSSEAIETALTSFNIDIFDSAPADLFYPHNDFWYVPLKTHDRNLYLGLLGLEAPSARPDLNTFERDTLQLLVQQAEFVLEDRRLQQNVFDALRDIVPEMERAQRVRSAIRYVGSPMQNLLEADSPVDQPDFSKMVHEALTHYWGGPKLTDSPLLNLKVVQEAANLNDGDTVKALRSVLGKAIENVRPSGERKMTASEWMLYNILELKFIQGLRVRDVARKLARSEADLYRKQKIAIDAVARALSEMEKQDSLSAQALQPETLVSEPVESG